MRYNARNIEWTFLRRCPIPFFFLFLLSLIFFRLPRFILIFLKFVFSRRVWFPPFFFVFAFLELRNFPRLFLSRSVSRSSPFNAALRTYRFADIFLRFLFVGPRNDSLFSSVPFSQSRRERFSVYFE